MNFNLVSFELCPFVQRSIIVLKYKNVPYSLQEIDLNNPPEWFEEVSPMGKVPVLLVDGTQAIFESAIINEFIDEVTVPRLHSSDPLKKAVERSWIEFGSELLSTLFELYTETDLNGYQETKAELLDSLSKLEAFLQDGPYFRGKEFSLVDAAYAPLLMRLKAVDPIWQEVVKMDIYPRIIQWTQTLLDIPAVKTSVQPDFQQKFRDYLMQMGSLALSADIRTPGIDSNHDTPGVISS